MVEIGEREMKNEFDEIKRMRQLIKSQDTRDSIIQHADGYKIKTLRRDGNQLEAVIN